MTKDTADYEQARAAFEADIDAARDAAAKKLGYAPPVDPKNRNRGLIRLTIAGADGLEHGILTAANRACRTPRTAPWRETFVLATVGSDGTTSPKR